MNRFLKRLEWKKCIVLSLINLRNSKNSRIYVFDKTLVLCIICGKCGSNYEKVFREKG